MAVIYFVIIFFFIILLLILLYLTFSKVKVEIDERRVKQVEGRIRPIFDKHMGLGDESDIPSNEILDLRKQVQKKAGLQAFNSIYFARKKQDGLTEKLHNYVKLIVDYQTISNNRIVRDKYRKSYILFLCAEYYIRSEEVIQFALESVNDKSLYVRNNALRVLANIGDVDVFMEAYHRISEGKLYFNNKFIVDLMDGFQGDAQELNRRLVTNIAEFSAKIQKNIIDHFSNQRISGFSNEILSLVQSSEDKELIIAGIRYFGEIHTPEAYNFIVDNLKSENYEVRAVCAKALALYPGDKTVQLLKVNITDSNWSVRLNCANTLIHLEKEDVFNKNGSVAEIIRGNDKFAREIMTYTLYSKGLIRLDQDPLAYFQAENMGKEE